MRLQPIIYTTDIARSVEWYGKVLGAEPSYQSDMWSTFDIEGATLAIHRVDDDLPKSSRVGISFVATQPLETLVDRWSSAPGVIVARAIQDEPFGRSVVLTDPDGTNIQVNEPFRTD